MFCSSHFPFLVFGHFWRRCYENMKILRNLCLHFARQEGQDGKKWKESHATKVTKIPKTKRQKYGMNKTKEKYLIVKHNYASTFNYMSFKTSTWSISIIENNRAQIFECEIVKPFWLNDSRQGRRKLPKAGWASSNMVDIGLTNLPKPGWAIAHCAHPYPTSLSDF